MPVKVEPVPPNSVAITPPPGRPAPRRIPWPRPGHLLDRSPEDSLEELRGMNVFFVTKDNKLITPKLTGTILEGITRDSILQLGQDEGLDVQERSITFKEWKDGVASGEYKKSLPAVPLP